MLTGRDELAVWGDPIEHSLSPRLHAAAYEALGLDWRYGRRRVDAAGFAPALAGLDASWRGLSLTMPLKAGAFAAAVSRDHRAELSGAVNTLLLTPDGPRGFNTDVGGIAQDLRDAGVAEPESARIVGAGATATSALLALHELGVRRVHITARRPDAAVPLRALAERIGIRAEIDPLTAHPYAPMPLTVATLPTGADVDEHIADALAENGGSLYDVVYGHWPTALARAWQRRGAEATAGTGMLTRQALLQVRIFVSGDPGTALPDESGVLAAMRAAVAAD